jgi:hypothetical protein
LRDTAAAAATDGIEDQQGREQQPDNCLGPANRARLLARRHFRDFRHLRSPGVGNCARRLLAAGTKAEQRPNCRDCSHSEHRETARKTAAITFSDVRRSRTSQPPEMQHQPEVGLVTRETQQRFPLAEFWFLPSSDQQRCARILARHRSRTRFNNGFPAATFKESQSGNGNPQRLVDISIEDDARRRAAIAGGSSSVSRALAPRHRPATARLPSVI